MAHASVNRSSRVPTAATPVHNDEYESEGVLMGMKFHKLYVAVLNPLGILLAAILAVLMLAAALNAGLIAEDSDIPYISNLSSLEMDALVWTLFGIVVAVFLFMLATEFLLVARKKTGIVLLSISLILGIISNVVSFARYTELVPWYTMVVSVAVSVLVLLYYWRRYKTFN